MKFDNPELQEIFESNKESLLERLKKINSISRDITQIENNLHKLGIGYHRLELDDNTSLIWDGEQLLITYMQHAEGRQEVIKKRLIETKASIQEKIGPLLVQFLKECLNKR